MKKNIQKMVLASSLSLALLICQPSFAQSTTVSSSSISQTQTSSTKLQAEEKKLGAFSLGLGIEYSQKVAAEAQGERESTTDIALAPSYKINSLLSATSKVVFSKENSGARQNSVSNTTVILKVKGLKLSEQLESLHAIGGVAPTSEDSAKHDRLRGAATITNGLLWSNPFMKAEYKLSLTKNFHEFNENAEGKANIEYRLSNALSLSIPITDKLSISTDAIYRIGRTYRGFQRNAFEINADINYDVLDQLSFNLGTSNDGNTLKANGVDSNISAYNENTSVFRAGMTLTL